MSALKDVPVFTRPVLEDLLSDLQALPQMLSITGPRRVGKSTLMRQIIRHLLGQGHAPDRLIYYSLDDPALFLPGVQPERIVDSLVQEGVRKAESGPVFLFLDEIQRFERWELYLKKYYDLQYPVRIVLSGSASSPIFKKSRESLVGRVKDYHLLPFSFREFLLFDCREQPSMGAGISEIHDAGRRLMGRLLEDPHHADLGSVAIRPMDDGLWARAAAVFPRYLTEGGFPEVWGLPDWEHKVEYLYDNQVRKVIYEDLVLAAEFRKPEQLKRFYLSLLERPGQEINLSKLARETGIMVAQLERYLPLLEMTDLLAHIEKFRKSPLRVRRGNVKFYLVDLALRNAVLRIQPDGLLADEKMLGLYAENLAFGVLTRIRGKLALDYYREKSGEVDFVLHVGARRYLPVEIKYVSHINDGDVAPVRRFMNAFGAPVGILVTRNREDFGMRNGILHLPLLHFLLLLG